MNQNKSPFCVKRCPSDWTREDSAEEHRGNNLSIEGLSVVEEH